MAKPEKMPEVTFSRADFENDLPRIVKHAEQTGRAVVRDIDGRVIYEMSILTEDLPYFDG